MAWTYNPEELEMARRAEHEAWAALAEARNRHRTSEHELPAHEHELLHGLGEEWRKAMVRLHAARQRQPG